MYKLLTEKENVDYWQFFQKEDSQHGLRGHSCIKCSFPASEQLSRNRSSATESWTIGTGYLRWLWMRILCRRSSQDMTDLAKIWEIKAHQLLIPSSTSTSTSKYDTNTW